jgi:DsbC/DsbD-like thiol-disulfide interchange protein
VLRYFRCAPLLCAAVLFAFPAQAQIQFLTQDNGADAPIIVEPSVAPKPSRAGEYTRLILEVRLQEPWYIYSIKSEPEQGPPPKIWISCAAAELLEGRYESPPTEKLDVATGLAQRFHAGPARIYADMRIRENARPGTHPLLGKFSFAACNAKICLPMRSVPFVTNVQVEEGGPRFPFNNLLPPPTP